MSKYTHLSRVYLGDEELYELLAPGNLAHRELLRLARRRGFIFSEKSKGADVRSRLVMLPSDWPLVCYVFENMARPDPEERKTSSHVLNSAEANDVTKIIEDVKDDRSETHGEIYIRKAVSPSTTRIEVTYTEVDASRALVYQRKEKKLFIEVTKEKNTISFIHNASDRAAAIVRALKAKITYETNKVPGEAVISLFGVRDAVLRTKFFTDVIRGIEGYKYENATDVSVDHRMPADENGDEEQESEKEAKPREKKNAAAAVKGLVNRMALNGEQVLAAELYQQAATTGYFISSINWSCARAADVRYRIDCVAGFRDPVKADEFSFDIVRLWKYNPQAHRGEESVKISADEKRDLYKLLETSAFRALRSIEKEIAANSGKTKDAASGKGPS